MTLAKARERSRAFVEYPRRDKTTLSHKAAVFILTCGEKNPRRHCECPEDSNRKDGLRSGGKYVAFSCA